MDVAFAQRFTGEKRTAAVASVKKGCLDEARSGNDVEPSVISKYCDCYANELIDRVTIKDVVNDNSARTEKHVLEAAKICKAQMPRARPKDNNAI